MNTGDGKSDPWLAGSRYPSGWTACIQCSPGEEGAGLPCDSGCDHRWKQGNCRSGRKMDTMVQKRHDVVRDVRRVGMPTPRICPHRHPPAVVLAIGDGALGFWAAVRKVYPRTKRQRCWVHKIRNVLSKLPTRRKKTQKRYCTRVMAMRAGHTSMDVENRENALE